MIAEPGDSGIPADSDGRPRIPLGWVGAFVVLWLAVLLLTRVTVSPDAAGVAGQALASAGLIVMFVGMLLFSVLIHRRYGSGALLGWPGWRRWLLELAIAVAAGIGWAIVVGALAGLSPELRRLMDPGPTIGRPVIIAPVVYLLVGCTLAPLAEEMFYRGVLYQALRRRLLPVFAVVVQAAVFGVMHPYHWAYMLIAFVSGLFFMGLALWRRTLWSPVLAHALTNAFGAISLLVLLISSSNDVSLGVALGDSGESQGARVVSVIAGSPAEQSGLEAGDVLLSIGDRAINEPADVVAAVARHEPGIEVAVEFIRDGIRQKVTAKLRKRRPCVLW